MKQVDVLSRRCWALSAALALVLAPVSGFCETMTPAEAPEVPPWYLLLGGGMYDMEGDEELDDGVAGYLGVGYDWNDSWGTEALLYYAPLDVSTSWRAAGMTKDSTYVMGIVLDGIFHFTRWEQLDPYLSAGIGYSHFGTELQYGIQDDFVLRGGGGVFYHFNDEWAVRADYRGMLVGFGDNPSGNSIISAGINWTWGVDVPYNPAVEGPIDSDAEGLSDSEETGKYKTDPHNPDTDGDGLTDYEEVKIYGTNPLEPDTDLDMLKDGEEVHHYKTDPLVADTDNGGVSDGHEVIEDNTDPLDPSDDLLLFSLNIEFDTNKADIKPAYFDKLNVIGKVLTRTSEATAKIEGHADKRKTSSRPYNLKLSQKRAEAVMSYLQQQCDIDGGRLRAKGYGFDRPVAPNDPVAGNERNRRVDVYVEGAENAFAAKNKAASQPADKSTPASFEDTVPVPAEDDSRVIK